MTEVPNGPAEIFGHAVENKSAEAQSDREEYRCPYLGERCWKQSRSLDVPFGICSVWYQNEITATCPTRFLDKQRIFEDVADLYFGSFDNLLLFSEIGTRAEAESGNSVTYTFDYVIVKHRPLSAEIVDFVIVEFQTVDTTNTGGLVDAFRAYQSGHNTLTERWNFGMNWKNVWKRCFTQILQKGLVMEKWGHKIFWVAQPTSYRRLADGYGLYGLEYDAADSTGFLLYEHEKSGEDYLLKLARKTSASADELFRAFQESTPIPQKSFFLERLSEKVSAKEMRLELGLQHGEE
ncbi:MAG: NotI family restriction endonuclease [Anaerolineae bacterium]